MSSQPITLEVIHLDVTDAFTAQPEKFARLRAAARKAGLSRQSYGVDVHNPTKLYWLLQFEHGFKPSALVWPTEEFGEPAALFAALGPAQPVSHFMPLAALPRAVTEAPITEVEVLTLKPHARLAEAVDAALARVMASEGARGACWAVAEGAGPSRRVYVFVGWDSVEHHRRFGEREREAAASGLLRELIEKHELAYVRFMNED